MRVWPVLAIVSAFFAASAVHAADKSLPQAVTGAFETVVIDAATAAARATEAAAAAITSKKKRKARKDAPSKDKGKRKDAAEGKDRGTTAEPPAADAASPPAKPGAPGAPATEGAKVVSPPPAGAAPPAAPAAEAGKAPAPAETAKKDAGPPTEWPAVEVDLARARCTQLLKNVDAVTVPEAPFRKGDCGTMAPVRLLSIGKSPEISFSPPPVVTCDLVVGLVKWMKEEVQPAARRHLGSEIIRVTSMSDYSCRMAYGRIGNKLSEHGKANALDIRSFTTRKGEEADVLAHWGETRRDVRRQLAAAKAAAEKAEAVKTAAELAAKQRAEVAEHAAKAETTGTALPRKTLIEGVPPKREAKLALPASVTRDGPLEDSFGAPARRLGGPDGVARDKSRKDPRSAADKRKTKNGGTVAALPGGEALEEVKVPPPSTPAGRFLHEVHAAGCRIFGTTLGPEANEAHRNHFHVDMAERKVRKICD